VARVDPDGRGLRMGLRSGFSFNRIEAGEKLYIDLLPPNWQGQPPALPQNVIDELAERARLAAIRAEQDRKAAGVVEFNPQASVRIGRNPTFLRVQFDWSVPTTGAYVQEGDMGMIGFEWPVGIDLRDLAIDLPPELLAVESAVNPDGSTVTLQLAEGIKPRFYENSPRQYILDIDIAGVGLPSFDAATLADGIAKQDHGAEHGDSSDPLVGMLYPQSAAKTVTPFVNVLGSTVRVVFPFEQDTPAAVFRRGDTVWMMFDTVSGIAPPAQSDELDTLAREFAVVASGDTQVVRVELSDDRLATLGSEGMAWVLSLGDIMLTPTEPIELNRRRDVEGDFDIDGVSLYPDSKVTKVDVNARDRKDGAKATVTLGFTSPATPAVAADWMAAEFAKKGKTVTRSGNSLSGTDEDGDAFTIDFRPDGAESVGEVRIVKS